VSRVSYDYLRALQLEGRHPEDVGVWGTTLHRMMVGEGVTHNADPKAFVAVKDSNILPDLPRLGRGLRGNITYFRNLSTINEIEDYLDDHKDRINENRGGVQISVPLYKEWVDAPLGRIPALRYDRHESTISHSVVIKDYDRKGGGEFKFWNNWGNWGDNLHGYLPYDYVERYAFECQVTYVVEHYLHHSSQKIKGLGSLNIWSVRTADRVRTYGFDFVGESREDRSRIAWCFVVDKGETLDIEEFYVRPEFRGRGYGRAMAERVGELIDKKRKAVNLWVPFADCRSESPQTFDALVAITRRLGLVFSKSHSHLTAYLARLPQHGEIGSSIPVEPDFVPSRPKSSFSQLLAAFALAVVPAQPPTELPHISANAAVEVFPEIGTKAWDEMNHRRNVLIRKEVVQGLDSLTGEERKEYEWLQKMSLQAVQQKQDQTQLRRDLMELRGMLRQEAKSG